MAKQNSARILVINSGSSSVKIALFDQTLEPRLIDIHIAGIGQTSPHLTIDGERSDICAGDYREAFDLIFNTLLPRNLNLTDISMIGHRVVHGGHELHKPTIVNAAVLKQLGATVALAPLHNPACIEGINAAQQMMPDCPQVAVFDTGFHTKLPTHAKLYALSDEVTNHGAIRRYGFHGISHEYVSDKAAVALGKPLKTLRLISCHLGNGCSVTAVENGRSVETSMGFTPLEGLVMGSRCGDLDPGVLIHLLRDSGRTLEELDILLNKESGLLGMTGSQDMREIEERAELGDESCHRAIQVFTHRLRKYIGAYTAVMGGVDAIVFTGGIGENSPLIRRRTILRFDYLGAQLDEEKNRMAKVNNITQVVDISAASSRVKIFVVTTDEESAIARSCKSLLKVTATH